MLTNQDDRVILYTTKGSGRTAGVRKGQTIMEITQEKLDEMIQKHELWLDFHEGECADFTGMDLRGGNFTGASLHKANFKNADLRGAIMISAMFLEANFIGANLEGANLERSDFNDVDMRNAILENANCYRANFEHSRMDDVNLKGANLKQSCLQGVNLSNANLAGANLEESLLRDARLNFADLQGANLHRADLQGADLPRGFYQAIFGGDRFCITYDRNSKQYITWNEAMINIQGAEIRAFKEMLKALGVIK